MKIHSLKPSVPEARACVVCKASFVFDPASPKSTCSNPLCTVKLKAMQDKSIIGQVGVATIREEEISEPNGKSEAQKAREALSSMSAHSKPIVRASARDKLEDYSASACADEWIGLGAALAELAIQASLVEDKLKLAQDAHDYLHRALQVLTLQKERLDADG